MHMACVPPLRLRHPQDKPKMGITRRDVNEREERGVKIWDGMCVWRLWKTKHRERRPSEHKLWRLQRLTWHTYFRAVKVFFRISFAQVTFHWGHVSYHRLLTWYFITFICMYNKYWQCAKFRFLYLILLCFRFRWTGHSLLFCSKDWLVHQGKQCQLQIFTCTMWDKTTNYYIFF